MKKSIITISVVMTVLFCCAMGCMAGTVDVNTDVNAEESAAAYDPQALLTHIFVMTDTDKILKNHRSFFYTEESNGEFMAFYADADCAVKDCSADKSYMRLRTDDFDMCLFNDGSFNRWVSFDSDRCNWGSLPEDILSETVLEVRESDGQLTVITEVSPEKCEEIIEEEYYDVEDSDKILFRKEYVLDAETLDLLSMISYDTMPDGNEITAWTTRIEYDVDPMYTAELESTKEHLAKADKMRTTTFIFDEGTDYECTYVYPTMVGDGCTIPALIINNGLIYRIDTERSTLTNEAKDNDAVLYLEHMEEEE